MRSWLVALVALCGCDYVWRVDHWDYPDARPPLSDSNFQPPDAGPCNGTLVGHQGGTNVGLLAYCVKTSPAAAFVLSDGFDTTGGLCDDVVIVGGIELCVKVANKIATTDTANLKGTRPLVLIGLAQITIDGAISVAAHASGNLGPGSDSVACASGSGVLHNKGGSGAAGGSFGTVGGKGGDTSSVTGGAALTTATPDHIRGGCAGGPGGDGPVPASGGPGGHAGGAIYMISPGMISINKQIDASGSAGLGGRKAMTTVGGGGGGGGGGSGGMIGLDSPAISLGPSAVLYANGGGGGGAGGATTDGNNGAESTVGTYLAPAMGGAATGDGGGAGGGGAASNTMGYAGLPSLAGGGGGGGEGYILIYTTGTVPTGIQASPSAYINGASS